MKYIVAKSFRWFEEYLKQAKEDKQNCVYLHNEQKTHGIDWKENELVLVAGWWCELKNTNWIFELVLRYESETGKEPRTFTT